MCRFQENATGGKISAGKVRISGVWKLAKGQMHPLMLLSAEEPGRLDEGFMGLIANAPPVFLEVSSDLSCIRMKGFQTTSEFSLDGVEDKFLSPLGGFRPGTVRCTRVSMQRFVLEIRRPSGLSTLECCGQVEEGGLKMKMEINSGKNTFTIYFDRAAEFPEDASCVHTSSWQASSERRRKEATFYSKLATVPDEHHATTALLLAELGCAC